MSLKTLGKASSESSNVCLRDKDSTGHFAGFSRGESISKHF